MALRMVRLTRSSSGRWAARKVIPADIQDAYGQGEVKRTWDAGLTDGQAQGAMAVWLAEVENRIAALRAEAKPVDTLAALDLSQRECRALAGLWYEDLKARYEATGSVLPLTRARLPRPEACIRADRQDFELQ